MKKVLTICALFLAMSGNAGAQGFLKKLKTGVDKFTKATEGLTGKTTGTTENTTSNQKKTGNTAKYKVHKTASTKEMTVDGGVYDMGYFSDGMAYVRGEKKKFFINSSGEKVFDLDIDNFYTSTEVVFDSGRLAILNRNQSYKEELIIYDKTGKQVKVISDVSYATRFMDGVAMIKMGSTGKYKTHYIDVDGNIIFQNISSLDGLEFGIYPLRDGLAKVKVNQKYGYRDNKGKMLVAAQFAEARDFCNGLAAVKNDDDKWGFIDTSGNYVINPIYSIEPGDYHSGYIRVTDKSSRSYFIDKSGTTVYTFEDGTRAADFSDDGYCCISALSSYIIDKSFKKTADLGQWAETKYLKNNMFWNYAGSVAHIRDKSGNILLTVDCDFLKRGFDNGPAPVKVYNEGICGYINEQGEVIVNFVDTQF